MSRRECGECTACCGPTFLIDEVPKRPGETCKHCTAQGCAIQATKPEPCAKFTCFWLDGLLPGDCRPDLVGAFVCDKQFTTHVFTLPGHRDAWREGSLGEWVRKRAEQLHVMIGLDCGPNGVQRWAYADLISHNMSYASNT